MRIPKNWVRFLSLLCLFPLTLSNTAAPLNTEILASYTFTSNDKSQLDAVADQFEIIHRDGSSFEVLVLAERTKDFLALVPDAKITQQNIHESLQDQLKVSPELFASYRSYDQVMAAIQKIVTDHPDLAAIETYGSSENGRPLTALKISDNVAVDEDEPEIMLTSGTHGDEIITVEVLLTLLEELMSGYGTNDRLTRMVNEGELYFILTVNPDGFASRSRYANGIDPNRNYPWPEQPTRTSNACISGIIDFVNGRNFVASMDLHAYGKLVMFPWAWTDDAPESSDLTKFQALGQTMAAANRYEVGQISKIIYVAKGSSADYYYWKHGTIAYGIEIASSKAPPTSSIPAVVTEVREMTWKFVENFL
jgi:carboxypeptidase T